MSRNNKNESETRKGSRKMINELILKPIITINEQEASSRNI